MDEDKVLQDIAKNTYTAGKMIDEKCPGLREEIMEALKVDVEPFTPILGRVDDRVDELEKRLEDWMAEHDAHRRAWTESYTSLATFHKELESRIEKLEKLIKDFQSAVCENLEKIDARFETLERLVYKHHANLTADGHHDTEDTDNA